jgi:hypothetical protein
VDNADITCLRTLLGVRNQINRDIIYTESGILPLSVKAKMRQINFLKKYRQNISLQDSPLNRAIQLAITSKSPIGLYINLLDTDANSVSQQFMAACRHRILSSDATRMETYRQFNSDLTVHPVYLATDISEQACISFTRMRLSSHYLRIETGRWSRLSRERRLCVCGQVQDEGHVLCDCSETANLRHIYRCLGCDSIDTLMSNHNLTALTQCVCDVLNKINKNY